MGLAISSDWYLWDGWRSRHNHLCLEIRISTDLFISYWTTPYLCRRRSGQQLRPVGIEASGARGGPLVAQGQRNGWVVSEPERRLGSIWHCERVLRIGGRSPHVHWNRWRWWFKPDRLGLSGGYWSAMPPIRTASEEPSREGAGPVTWDFQWVARVQSATTTATEPFGKVKRPSALALTFRSPSRLTGP